MKKHNIDHSKAMMKMDQSTCTKQQKVIDDLSMKDFERMKNWNSMTLFESVTDEQKLHFWSHCKNYFATASSRERSKVNALKISADSAR